DCLLGRACAVLAFANVIHFFAYKLPSLRRSCLARTPVSPNPFQRLSLRHMDSARPGRLVIVAIIVGTEDAASSWRPRYVSVVSYLRAVVGYTACGGQGRGMPRGSRRSGTSRGWGASGRPREARRILCLGVSYMSP